MRIFTKITGLNLAPDLSLIELEVEKTKLPLLSLLPLVRDVNFIRTGSDSPFTLEFFLDCPFQVQSILYGGLEVTFDVVKDDGLVVFKNFINNVTVNEFQAKKNYLIPFTAGAVTDIQPKMYVKSFLNASNSTGTLISGTHYLYLSTQQMQVRNGDSFTAIIFDVDNIAAAKELDNSAVTQTFLAANVISPRPIVKSDLIKTVGTNFQNIATQIVNFKK